MNAMFGNLITGMILSIIVAGWCPAAQVPGRVMPAASEFVVLKAEIVSSRDWDMKRLQRETLRKEALILDSDHTPVDIVWRRTTALLADIKAMKNAPDLSSE